MALFNPHHISKEVKMGPCYLCEAKTRSHSLADKYICHKCWIKMSPEERDALEQRITVNKGIREQEKMKTMEMVKTMRVPREPVMEEKDIAKSILKKAKEESEE